MDIKEHGSMEATFIPTNGDSHEESEHKATKEEEVTRLLCDLHFQSAGTFRPRDPLPAWARSFAIQPATTVCAVA